MLLVLVAPTISGCKDDSNNNTENEANRVEEYKVIDDAILQAYLVRNGIGPGPGINQYERTESGLYLVRKAEGPSGPNIVANNRVEIKYVGRFARPATEPNNENVVFDNSTERGVPCGCFPVTVGKNEVIRGWEEGLLLMKKGDRKLLLVPSYLGYGRGKFNAQGALEFPGDEPLVFDMTVLDVR